MNRHYAMQLLREALKQPKLLVTRRKFWKVAFFEHYLERCNELLFRTPAEGLAFAKYAPALATKIAEANPESSSGPVLRLQAYSHLGSAYRAVCEYDHAEQSFRDALKYERHAPGPIVADLYRRLAYLRILQRDPEAFRLIDEAIAIFKRGNLVDRHDLGRCLLCRGYGFFEFKRPGKSFEDLTAALNHLSLRKGPRPYYSALHNLTVWAAHHGTKEQLQMALENLTPALSILHSYNRRHFAKLKFRWLVALFEGRVGHEGAAEESLLEVEKGLERLKMPYEIGMVAIDRAMLYRRQGRYRRLKPLAEETAAIFRRIGTEPAAQEALDTWRQAGDQELKSEGFLEKIRSLFAEHAEAMPAVAT